MAFCTVKLAPQTTIRTSAAQSAWRARRSFSASAKGVTAIDSVEALDEGGIRLRRGGRVAAESALRIVEAPAVERRGSGERHPQREADRRRPLRRGPCDNEALRFGDENAALGRDLFGCGDAFTDHVPALAPELQIGLALDGAAQVGEQVGAKDLD